MAVAWTSPAFPTEHGGKGMSLREYVAMQALEGILANQAASISPEDAAKRAVACAEALKKELDKLPPG